MKRMCFKGRDRDSKGGGNKAEKRGLNPVIHITLGGTLDLGLWHGVGGGNPICDRT